MADYRKKEVKKTKFHKCKSCKRESMLMICECGENLWKLKKDYDSKKAQ